MSAPVDEVKQTRYEKFEEGMRGFCKFLYNKESGEVMGRNGASWAKIGVFYVIFYGCLAGFFAIVMTVFLSTLNKPGEGGPKLTQYIKNKPGLTGPVHIGSYNQSKFKAYQPIAENIHKYLSQFNHSGYSNTTMCPSTGTDGYSGSTPCRFDLNLLGNCSGVHDKYYGLPSGQPCFFVSMNKVFDWVPSSDGTSFVKLVCNGDVNVQPEGFLITAFPYRGQDFYRTPPVAVQALRRGQTIRCYLKGKDIDASGSYNNMKSYGNLEFKV